jgi:competence protein ComEC
MMERPLFLPLASIVAGLTIAFFYGEIAPTYIYLLLIVVSICSIFIKTRSIFLTSLSLVIFFAANHSLEPFLLPIKSPPTILRYVSDKPFIIEGVIDSRPETTETGFRFSVIAERIITERFEESVSGRLLVTVKNGNASFITGDRVRFIARIKAPRNFGLPGEFDTEQYLAFRSIFATCFVKDNQEIILMGESGQFGIRRQIDLLAVSLGKFISKSCSGPEGTILKALLIGDMGSVPDMIRSDYTKAGVNHILSISGFHVGIIAIFIFQLLLLSARASEFLLLRLNVHRTSLILTIPILAFYLFLSGAAPATIRSVIMIVVYIVALSFEREVDAINSLMLAAVMILSITPAALFDLSFQLSFLAIWGILIITPILAAPFNRLKGKVLHKLILFFSSSVAAIAATLLPVAYYFHRTTAIGIVSNFIIVPLLGYGAVIIGFIALPFVFAAPFLAEFLFMLAAQMVKVSNLIISRLAELPMLPVINPSRIELLLFYLFMVAITFKNKKKIKQYTAASIALLFIASISTHKTTEGGKLLITFLSVGQGESILINLPCGKNMLIDGGGSPLDNGWDTGERLVAPALWKMGIDTVDYLVLSHPHPDHIKGLNYIADNFHVKEFWQGRSYPEIIEYRDLETIIRRRKIKVRDLNSASPAINIGGTKIEPLAPFVDRPVSEKDLNDESMVFHLKEGEFSALFTGDIGMETESLLVRKANRVCCMILKIPHHGSGNSTSIDFLKATRPLYAVVSAGYENNFHLPSDKTLKRLDEMKINLFRTDLDGTIQFIYERGVKNPISIRKIGHFH